MKLNKTLMIAALIAGSVFAADMAACAQDTNKPAADAPPGGPGARNGRMNFETVAKELVLTDDQKTKVKPIFEEMQQKMADVRKDNSIQGADRTAKNKEIRAAATAKLKEVPLTQEQLDKWQKLFQQRGRRGAVAPPPAGDNKPPQ